MPGIQRQNIHRGPGAAVIGSTVIHDQNGITAEIEQQTQQLSASVSGPLDTIATDRQGSVKLTPCGQMSPEILAALYPHQSPQFGSSIYGAADTALEIFGMDGKTLKFLCAALTGIPALNLSAIKTAFGEAEWTALTANGKLPGEADDFYTTGNAAYSKGYPEAAGITGHAYAVKWGALDITDMTGDGAAVTFDLGLKDVTTDRGGTIDKLLSALTVRATLTPVGIDAAGLLAMRNTSAPRGTSLAGNEDLTITTSPTLSLPAHSIARPPCAASTRPPSPAARASSPQPAPPKSAASPSARKIARKTSPPAPPRPTKRLKTARPGSATGGLMRSPPSSNATTPPRHSTAPPSPGSTRRRPPPPTTPSPHAGAATGASGTPTPCSARKPP